MAKQYTASNGVGIIINLNCTEHMIEILISQTGLPAATIIDALLECVTQIAEELDSEVKKYKLRIFGNGYVVEMGKVLINARQVFGAGGLTDEETIS